MRHYTEVGFPKLLALKLDGLGCILEEIAQNYEPRTGKCAPYECKRCFRDDTRHPRIIQSDNRRFLEDLALE